MLCSPTKIAELTTHERPKSDILRPKYIGWVRGWGPMFRSSTEKRFSLVWVGLEDFPQRLKVVFSCAFSASLKNFWSIMINCYRVSTALHAFVVSSGKLNYSKYFHFLEYMRK